MAANGVQATAQMQVTEPISSSANKHQFGEVFFTDTDIYLKGLMPAKGTKDPSVDPIKKIEHFRIRPRWLFVRVETEKGIVGWGEATLEGEESSVCDYGHKADGNSQVILRLWKEHLLISENVSLDGMLVTCVRTDYRVAVHYLTCPADRRHLPNRISASLLPRRARIDERPLWPGYRTMGYQG